MGIINSLLKITPAVSPPKREVPFKEKMIWTLLSLLVYFSLSSTFVVGMSSSSLSYFEQVSAILGAAMGTFATLGIGPIVTASIILQLLVGSGLMNVDLNSHEGRAWFQGTQKLLALLFAFLEATSLVLFGAIKPASPSQTYLVIGQIALGAIIIIYLDEIISRWGIGSGVSWFILAGVSKTIFTRGFAMDILPDGKFHGLLPQLIQSLVQGGESLSLILSVYVIPLLATLLVFLVVVYAQSMRVEVPLVMSSFRGFGRKWPLKFIYTSNMPVILASALLINLQVWGRLLYNKGISFLGKFDASGNPIGGFLYYLTPPHNFIINLFSGNVMAVDIIRASVYLLFLIGASIMFSVFWVNTSGMGPKQVAQQIINAGMQIPGFRRDPRVIERVLERYIPALAVLGGAFVGLLAGFADLMGVLSSGTGLLLSVMIAHNIYEQIVKENIEAMPSLLRRFMFKG